MSARRTIATITGALLGALWLTGCGTPAGMILQPGVEAPVWPAAPETPRIRYLGEIKTDRDLKPAKSGLEAIGSAIFGEEAPRGMVSPMAVTTDGASRVFVADSNGQKLHVFDLETRKYATWAPAGGFGLPVAVAFDPAGRVLVSDSVGGCVYAFDLKGVQVGQIGKDVLKRPCGLAVAKDGRLFVADVRDHEVLVFSSEGKLVKRIGGRGSVLGYFNYPTNLAFDSQGQLYVSDSLNFRVQVFSPELEAERQIGKQGDLPGYFSQPKGIALDPDDHVYVVDANFEAVQLFNADGALLMSMGREGKKPGEFWLPAGIHIDPNGRIWIADSYNQRVQVFQYLREGEKQ